MPFCDSAQINNEGVAARGEIERERKEGRYRGTALGTMEETQQWRHLPWWQQ